MRYERGLTTLSPWPRGMNNLTSDRGLPAGDDGAVRNAVNVDFAGPEELYSRKGMRKVYSATNARFGFSCPLGEYIVEGTDLKKFNTNNTATLLRSGVLGTTCTFDYFNDVLYFSDGLLSLKITSSAAYQWGMSVPAAPILSGTAGIYGAGVYQACCAWVDANGVESGASPVSSITVTDNAGIVFTLPTTTDPQVVATRLYLSTANGKEMYHVADTTAASYTVAAGRYDEGATAEHLFVSPAPAGSIIRIYKGRAYVADAYGTVWYSDPFELDHFRPGTNFLQFPEVVDIMEPVANGIFFAYGNQTDFYAGTPEDGFDIRNSVLNYGGVYGTGKKIPKTDPVTVSWQSQRGMVVGSSDGQCKNVQEANVAVDTAVSGASLIREQNGIRQYIVSLHQPTVSTLAAKSWIDAEVIRRT